MLIVGSISLGQLQQLRQIRLRQAALRRDLQGRGAGTEIFSELLFRLPYRYLRLGYVKGNRESERFWKKLHFAPTGLEIPGEAYTMVVI